jgi:hypothetical protein
MTPVTTPTQTPSGEMAVMLSRLLELHDDAVWPQGVSRSLGDSLLCERSAIHRRVRERLLAQGYTLSNASTETSGLYDCMPLLALESVLTRRVIPYRDNVTALRRVVASQPDTRLPVPFLVNELAKNYLLHESCHCLAHDALFGSDRLRDCAQAEPIEFVLRMTLAEAFAVATEFMAAAQRDPAVALFGALSSYTCFTESHRSVVATAVEHLGWTGAFKAAIYGSFLAQLLLPGEAAVGVAELALAGCGIAEGSDAYRRAFLPLFEEANALAPGFRTVTAPTFLAYLGMKESFLEREFREQVLAGFRENHERAMHELCSGVACALMGEGALS